MMSCVRKFQEFAGRLLYPVDASLFTDVELWKVMQSHLIRELRELEKLEGGTPDEEGELLLAILMGYCVTVRNSKLIDRILERAERVLPCLTDKVLRCKLAAFCYRECPDRELLELVRSLLVELKREGRGEEILRIEEFLSDEF